MNRITTFKQGIVFRDHDDPCRYLVSYIPATQMLVQTSYPLGPREELCGQAQNTDPLLTCYRSRIMSELLPSEKYSLPAVLLHWAIAVPGDQVFRRMLP